MDFPQASESSTQSEFSGTRRILCSPYTHLRHPSQPRIEVKLLHKQSAADRRLAALRKEKEEEELSVLQPRPTISQKSQKLAQRAEKRFFLGLNTKLPTPSLISPSLPPSSSPTVQPSEPETPQLPSTAVFKENLAPTTLHFAPKRSRSVKKPKKRMYDMSVIARNECWLRRKTRKLMKQRELQQVQELDGCTFAPEFCAQIPQAYQKFSADRSRNTSLYLTGTLRSKATTAREIEPIKTTTYSALSPFRVPVAFPAGCDLDGLIARGN